MLKELYDTTDGANWTVNTGWDGMSADNFCYAHGITCDSNYNVASMYSIILTVYYYLKNVAYGCILFDTNVLFVYLYFFSQ